MNRLNRRDELARRMIWDFLEHAKDRHNALLTTVEPGQVPGLLSLHAARVADVEACLRDWSVPPPPTESVTPPLRRLAERIWPDLHPVDGRVDLLGEWLTELALTRHDGKAEDQHVTAAQDVLSRATNQAASPRNQGNGPTDLP